jgi:Protein of unknown function (DUF551)
LLHLQIDYPKGNPMTDRLISLNAAIEAVRQLQPKGVKPEGVADHATITIAQAVEALSALPDAWQGMETAPRDGSVILLADNDGYVAACWWHADQRGFWEANSHPVDYCDKSFDAPTHWMPLPAPPK